MKTKNDLKNWTLINQNSINDYTFDIYNESGRILMAELYKKYGVNEVEINKYTDHRTVNYIFNNTNLEIQICL
jgi:hypothetical protein